jgi:branched-chain amino acid transport system substrate-binding protein
MSRSLQRIPRPLAYALFASLVVAFAACSSDDGADVDLTDIDRSPDTPVVIPAGVPIVVGTSSALTGPIEERGREYLNAVTTSVELWKSQNGALIGGHEIEVVAEDDGCSERGVSVVAAERLLQREGLVGVIGPQCSGGAATAIPVYRAGGVVSVSGSATATGLTEGQVEDGFFFRTAYRNDLEGTMIALFLTEAIDADLVYIIDDDEFFGIDLANAVARLLLTHGGVTVVRESVSQGDVDFSDLASRIATDNPDFVAFAGFNPEAALFLRQIRDSGYEGLFGAGDGAASQGDFVEPLGEVAEGALFAGCGFPLPEDFESEFVALHGDVPQASFPGQFADAATALLDAVAAVADLQDDGSLVIDPAELRDAVRATDLQGVTGPIAFDSQGDRVPRPGDELEDIQDQGFELRDAQFLIDLGLVQCQVQDGQIIDVSGPGTPDVRF